MKTIAQKLLIASVLTLAASAMANAASTISDRSYWPSEARSVSSVASSPFDAQASIAGEVTRGPKMLNYVGGPKTGSFR